MELSREGMSRRSPEAKLECRRHPLFECREIKDKSGEEEEEAFLLLRLPLPILSGTVCRPSQGRRSLRSRRRRRHRRRRHRHHSFILPRCTHTHLRPCRGSGITPRCQRCNLSGNRRKFPQGWYCETDT